jgi:predicted O-linked N-acetylglucosamine transferase (SPINDLY family)
MNTRAMLSEAAQLLSKGDLSGAQSCVKRILALYPDDPDALHLRGVIGAQAGDLATALKYFDASLTLRPSAQVLANRARAFEQLGRMPEALESYQRAQALAPHDADLLLRGAMALWRIGRREAALEAIDRALALLPRAAGLWSQRGSFLRELGRIDEALASFERALHESPDHYLALLNKGVLLRQSDRHVDAVAVLRKATAAKPADAAGWIFLSDALLQSGHTADALASLEHALALEPQRAETWSMRAVALVALQRLEEAVGSCDRALALDAELVNALCCRGVALGRLERYDEALQSYDAALARRPDDLSSLYHRADVLLARRRFSEACCDLEALLAHAPDYPFAEGMLFMARSHDGDWTDRAAACERLHAGALAGRKVAEPFAMLWATDAPAAQLCAARTWTAEHYTLPGERGRRVVVQSRERLRVAYVSADFRAHATAFLIAELFERHDRSQFETFGIALNRSDGSPMRARLERSFDRFVDVTTQADDEAARLVESLGINVLVDLKGHTARARPRIMSQRPAPIQVSYLGYPGTLGAEFIDYLIADRYVVPPGARPFYSESIVYLPDSYQVNDSLRPCPEPPGRRAAGLPDRGLVFCSFNQVYKITPEVFGVWMRLLRNIDESVLWLLDSSGKARSKLLGAARTHGIAPERLVFAPSLPLAPHLGRLRVADLFLDTLPVNAHTTASDALWVGVPVLTCSGESFASRVAGSLLRTVGLPQFITYSLEEYERVALELARDPERLRAARHHLLTIGRASPLFDTERFRRHLEAAFKTMWTRYATGENPADFEIAPIVTA